MEVEGRISSSYAILHDQKEEAYVDSRNLLTN